MGVSKGTKAPSRDGKTQPSRVSCRLPAVFRCEDSPGGGSGGAAQPLKAEQEQQRSHCEFERDLLRERTYAGLVAARARGRLFGRPKVLGPRKVEQLRTLAKDERTTVGEICQTLGISRATFYRYLK